VLWLLLSIAVLVAPDAVTAAAAKCLLLTYVRLLCHWLLLSGWLSG
jgi:hypothetical protein